VKDPRTSHIIFIHEHDEFTANFSFCSVWLTNLTHTHHSLLLFILIILVAVITHRYRTSLQSAHLAFVFQSLGNLLAVLVTIDNIIESNEHLKEVRYCPPSLSFSYANSHRVRY
jgi:hypothetical protein